MLKDILVLSGYGLDIRVSGGHLKIKDGFTFDKTVQERFINRGTNEIEHLVILGQTGMISFEAIRWITDQKMMVSMIDSNGNLITNLMPESHILGITKRRQATASESLNIQIAAWLLAEKFKGQRQTLIWMKDNFERTDWWTSNRESRVQDAISILCEREDKLTGCLNVDAQRILEAQAAAAYWHCFEGIPLKWSKPSKVPLNWLAIGNRTSPKTKSTRKAIDPFNAALNYLYAVLETKTRQTCFINNIDPDFGILHVDRGSRTSLVFDLMEPVRPQLDRILFNWIYEQTFNYKDFFETREGVCRISKDIVSEIIPLTVKLNNDINKTVKKFSSFFRNKIVSQKPEYFESEKNTKPRKSNKSKSLVEQDTLSFSEEIIPSTKNINDDITKRIPKDGYIFCLECGIEFQPKTITQKFCCDKHRKTYNKRLQRQKRQLEGNCPQCGKPMKVAAAGTMKERLTYCDECRDYWRKRY